MATEGTGGSRTPGKKGPVMQRTYWRRIGSGPWIDHGMHLLMKGRWIWVFCPATRRLFACDAPPQSGWADPYLERGMVLTPTSRKVWLLEVGPVLGRLAEIDDWLGTVTLSRWGQKEAIEREVELAEQGPGFEPPVIGGILDNRDP